MGMVETKMTQAEIDVFKTRLLPVWDQFAGKYYPKADLAEIRSMLSEYRVKHKNLDEGRQMKGCTQCADP